MRSSRLVLLLSPLLLLLPYAFPAFRTADRGTHKLVYIAINLAIAGLCGACAKLQARDDYWWWVAAYVFPFITPIVLAVMPSRWGAPLVNFKRGLRPHWDFTTRAARGSFEERFPLLLRCLEGQPEATRAGLEAHFQVVKVNFEFLVGVNRDGVTRLVLEAQDRGFVVWTGIIENVPLVYGAGLVRPKAVDETSRWLASAGVSGQKLTIACRDAAGAVRFIENRLGERLPLLTRCLADQPEAARIALLAHFQGVAANFEFLLGVNPIAGTRLLAEAQEHGFAVWTGASGNTPIAYGAGMVPLSGVQHAVSWLATAGAPGGELTIAFRDANGIQRFIDHRFDQAAAAKA
jgi:hypothetical protein